MLDELHVQAKNLEICERSAERQAEKKCNQSREIKEGMLAREVGRGLCDFGHFFIFLINQCEPEIGGPVLICCGNACSAADSIEICLTPGCGAIRHNPKCSVALGGTCIRV